MSDFKGLDQTRRDFVKTATYIAPAILTLKAVPALAQQGSVKGNNGLGNGVDPQPPGDPKENDTPIAVPGNPHP